MRIAMYTTGLFLMLLALTGMVLQPFVAIGTSMEPTIHTLSWNFDDIWTYRFHPVRRGDIISFIAPPMPAKIFLKRVISIPGDTLTVDNTTVILNGVVQQETYV